jgi:siroheme synthase-like protein
VRLLGDHERAGRGGHVHRDPVDDPPAGRIAARKIEALLEAGADVYVVAPKIGDDVAGLRGAGRVTVDEREFAPGDLDGAWLATTATDETEVNRAVFEAGESRGVWVNSADDPDNCSFTLMSVVRRGDVVVAIDGTALASLEGAPVEALGRTIRAHSPVDALALVVLRERRERRRRLLRTQRDPVRDHRRAPPRAGPRPAGAPAGRPSGGPPTAPGA